MKTTFQCSRKTKMIIFGLRKILFLFGVFSVLIFSCSKQEDNVVVRVGDKTLSKDTFLNRYKITKDYSETSVFTKDKIRNTLDKNFVEELLILVEASKTNFDKKPEVVEKIQEERKRLLIKANGPLYNLIIKDKLNTTEAELRGFYDQIKDQIRIAQIVVSSKELADSLYQALQNGADFTKIASAFSIDIASKDRGGNVNRLFTQGTLGSNFDEAAFSLRINEISKPIKTNYGYQLIKLISKQKAKKQPFEKMKPILQRKLKSKKISDFTLVYYDQLFKTYKFSVEPENAKKIITAFANSNNKAGKPQISIYNISDEDGELPVILFKGGNWSVKEFINKYNNSSYINHIPLRRVDDVLSFGYREGIKDLMYLEAVSLKLDRDENFKRDFASAKDPVIAREYRKEITKGITELSEEELKLFYEKNKQKYQGRSFDVVRNQVVRELKNFKAEEKINRVISGLRQKYQIEYNENVIDSIVHKLNDSKKK